MKLFDLVRGVTRPNPVATPAPNPEVQPLPPAIPQPVAAPDGGAHAVETIVLEPDAPLPPLEHAPATLDAWLQAFDDRDIPVLSASARALEALRRAYETEEDALDAHAVADSLDGDPLMVLKVLRHAVQVNRQRRRPAEPPKNLTEAVMMLGLGPFFRAFGPQRTVALHLAGMTEATRGVEAVLMRSRRAARFAQGFAAQRCDIDGAVLHEAALLHDFAELLLWTHAPALALRIQALRREYPTMRSSEAQRQVLGMPLSQLQQALLRRWMLPELLVRLADDEETEDLRVRNVQLAIRIARHTASGWHDPALPSDILELAGLLNLKAEPAMNLVRRLDA